MNLQKPKTIVRYVLPYSLLSRFRAQNGPYRGQPRAMKRVPGLKEYSWWIAATLWSENNKPQAAPRSQNVQHRGWKAHGQPRDRMEPHRELKTIAKKEEWGLQGRFTINSRKWNHQKLCRNIKMHGRLHLFNFDFGTNQRLHFTIWGLMGITRNP